MRLIIVCGLPGTGKSEVAKLIASMAEGSLLKTDILRKKVGKIFSPKAQKVYQLLLKIAKGDLLSGKSVILDGTFYSEDLRNEAVKLAQKYEAQIHFIEVVCKEKIIKDRIEKRLNKDNSESEANYLAYLKMKKVWEPIKEKHIIIDNSKDLKWLKEQVKQLNL